MTVEFAARGGDRLNVMIKLFEVPHRGITVVGREVAGYLYARAPTATSVVHAPTITHITVERKQITVECGQVE